MITLELLQRMAEKLKQHKAIDETYLRMPNVPEAEPYGRSLGFAPFSPVDEELRDGSLWMIK